MVEGFQVHLGGRLGSGCRLQDAKLRAEQTADEMPACVERVLQNFSDERDGTESFADWVEAHRRNRCDERRALLPLLRR